MRLLPNLLLCSLSLVFCVSQGVAQSSPLLVEDHSEALCHWYKAGIRDATLVHVDDHDDFYSSLVRIPSEPSQIRAALENSRCADLQLRTSHQIQSDALYGIADFIYPAWQLGVVAEVWWVLPEKKPLDSTWLQNFTQQKAHRYPADFLSSLKLNKNRVEGLLNGMPVRMLTLQQLPAFERPVLLDIDVDYFLGFYDNPLEKQMISLVGDFFKQLFTSERDTELITISVSSNGGYTPIRFRYLADWMATAFSDLPELAKNGPPETWKLQSGFEYADYLLDRTQAAGLNNELERLLPDTGQAAYNRAWMAAQQGDVEQALKNQVLAVERDARYVLGFQELADKFQQLGKQDAVEKLLRQGLLVDPQRASLYTRLGSFLLDNGRVTEAVEIFSSGAERLPKVAILRAGLAFALIKQQKISAAAGAFAIFRQLAQPGQNTDAVLKAWKEQQP